MYHAGILVLLVVYHLDLVTCCWGGGYYYYGSDPPTTTKKPTVKDDLERNLPGAWGGFDIPKDVVEEWRNWLDEYKENRIVEANENSSAYDKDRGPGSGWPYNWEGIGGGYAGSPPEEPPPWAYAPVDIGLPPYCYDSPTRGSCDKEIERFAFNVYIEKCIPFTYSGCGGNQNNFLDKLKCEEDCMTPPPSGCDPKTDIKIEDYTIFENRRTNVRKCGYF